MTPGNTGAGLALWLQQLHEVPRDHRQPGSLELRLYLAKALRGPRAGEGAVGTETQPPAGRTLPHASPRAWTLAEGSVKDLARLDPPPPTPTTHTHARTFMCTHTHTIADIAFILSTEDL